jgi:MOSC domain-containing protein YiiM
MARVVAVCKSQKKGTKKKAVISGGLLQVNFGLVGDAHADSGTHRQVSLLAMESIAKMRDLGLEVKPGDFAENLTTEDIDLVALPVGTRLSVGNQIVLEVSQIGKECHTRCAIYRQVGTCIMPEEGVFAKVIKGGPVSAGDSIKVV